MAYKSKCLLLVNIANQYSSDLDKDMPFADNEDDKEQAKKLFSALKKFLCFIQSTCEDKRSILFSFSTNCYLN